MKMLLERELTRKELWRNKHLRISFFLRSVYDITIPGILATVETK